MPGVCAVRVRAAGKGYHASARVRHLSVGAWTSSFGPDHRRRVTEESYWRATAKLEKKWDLAIWDKARNDCRSLSTVRTSLVR